MYAAEENLHVMMRPWITPLSRLGNHKWAILYDAKRHVVGIHDEMACGGSADRNLFEGRVFGTRTEEGTIIYYKRREDGTEEECEPPEWVQQAPEGDDAEGREDQDRSNGTEDEGYASQQEQVSDAEGASEDE